MLNEVKQMGLEKFAGDEELAEQFLAGFVAHVMLEKEASEVALEKEAAQGPQGPQKLDPGHEVAQSFLRETGKATGGLAVGLGLTALASTGKYVVDHFRYNRFLKSLHQAISSSHILQSADRAKVEKYADTIYSFAPMVATDPNLLQSVLTNAVHGDGVDIMTIKSLTDLEGRWKDNASFSPKSFV